MNRIFSNLILGFFIVMLFVVYSFAKQGPDVANNQAVVANDTVTAQEAQQEPVESTQKSEVILPSGKQISVDVADDASERVEGLSGRETMNADAGMLFVFPSLENQVIWMKDMKFDIDIIWINDQGEVVHIEKDAKKPEPGILDAELSLYASMEPTTYILEVPAGVAQSERLKVGDKVQIKI